MTANRFRTSLVAVCLTLAVAASASAQVFGTFNFQMQPYCNVVTMTITQIPTGYTLDGFDDQCAALKRASVVGMATLNPDGTVGVTFTIVTAPGGKGVHVSAVISPVTGSGTWTDSVANTGTFVLAGAVPGLPPRPLPTSGIGAAVITSVEIATGAIGTAQLAANAVTGANVVNGSLTSADLGDAPRTAAVEPSDATLTTTDTVVAQVTISAPANGRILANASGYYYTTDGGVLDTARCSLTTGTAFDINRMAYLREFSAATLYGTPFALTRAFSVTAGASTTVRLVCNVFSGSAQARSLSLTALFVAQ